MIPTPDAVIARVNTLGSDQPEQLIFTDRNGRLIGDVGIPGVDDEEAEEAPLPAVDPTDVNNIHQTDDENVELPGVDGSADLQQNQTPPNIEVDDPPIHAPNIEPVANAGDELTTMQRAPTDTGAKSAPPQQPAIEPGLCRSSRNRTKTKPGYVPSLKGTKYSYAVTQLEQQGVLNPDAHMFMQQEFYQADPYVVAMIMTQLSLKSGLREWGDTAYKAAHSEMKQLHFRDTFRPMHYRQLSKKQRQMILESHMFLKQKTVWKDQRPDGCRWQQTARLHPKGRCKLANRHHGGRVVIMHRGCK